MKKGVKIGHIIGASLCIVTGARAGLTKLGVIPNRFDIEILCSGDGYINSENEIGDFYEKMDNLQPGDNCQFECEAICNQYPIVQDCENFCVDNCIHSGYNQDADDSNEEKNDRSGGGISPFIGFPQSYNQSYKKPIIYLYPNAETQIHVQLGNPERLSHTYPKYNSDEGRNIIAKPNGDLVDLKTGRELYSLYREGENHNELDFTEGFVVKGEDTIPFLEEKLAILGLNEREAEEFIVYRLPQMENNPYNLIRFETLEEQNESMPLNITPTPDTVIRVMMDWKSLDESINIPEQALNTPERSGFVVIERGGSMIN